MSKKKAGKYVAKKKKSRKGLVTVLVTVLLLLGALAAVMLWDLPGEGAAPAETEAPVTGNDTQETEAALAAEASEALEEEPSSGLGYGLQITDMGAYTGMYMEDGTDEIVSGVLMLVVENTGDQDIQYAEITVDFADSQGQFTLTTLPVGEKVVLLEKNRLQWEDTMDDGTARIRSGKVACFQEPISTMEDKLKIGIVDGAINVTNISGEDIPGTITVYYKNAAADICYGGITYRIQIQGGLKSGEIRQVMTNHASDTGSRIMFVTVGP